MSRTVYYTATTLDGFIADENHSLDWLHRQRHDPEGPMAYGAFSAGVGALAMGATTYEWILDHASAGGDWPYRAPSWVFTHRRLRVVEGADVRFASGDVRDAHPGLVAAAGDRDVWIVGGGDLAGQFADAGLLDEVVVTIAPVTLGAGAPLLPRALDLRLEEVARNEDFAAARYSVVRKG